VRTETITESKATPIALGPEDAAALNRLGRSLASKSKRHGLEDDEDAPDRTVIRCTPTSVEGTHSVRVSDAVGVVGVSDQLQIEVQPKIPLSHLIYLMTAAEELPRLDEQDAEVDFGENLLELIARWYVKAAEKLLRRGLIKDYSPRRDFLAAKRGRLDTVRTARAYYSGRIGFECEFDEFDTDTPLNRVVREGASVVVRNPSLTPQLRRDALRIRNRMDGVSGIRPHDLRVQSDRRAACYLPSLPLAKQLIRAEGRSLQSGTRDTWSFLIRTPEMIEAGLREVLRRSLAPRWSVEEGYAPARGAAVSFNPDLDFGEGLAVGDVKYKLATSDWNRSDLNQIVAFVAAYDCAEGAVFSFSGEGQVNPPDLGIGRHFIRSIHWDASGELSPVEAARQVAEATALWLSDVEAQGLEVVA
jgi:5-methylcytosine-specific restriction enzyme subunit McrC